VADQTQGKLVRASRKKRGMSQDDLAEAIDVSQPTISVWELDRWNVPRSKIGPLAHILGIPREKMVEAIDRTEFPTADVVIFHDTGTGKTDAFTMTFLELKQELDRFRSINDQLTVYLERVARLEPMLERLEEGDPSPATPPTAPDEPRRARAGRGAPRSGR
jgi:transcriptional regulator with XRE-family HTH domain